MARIIALHFDFNLLFLVVSRWGFDVSDFEVKRQIDILDAGGEVANETRAFDFESG